MAPRVVYVLPATSLHGGNRVVFEHAEGLSARGYEVTVVSPEPPPDWHRPRVPYRQVALGQPGAIPPADICIGTFWSTVDPAFRSGAPHVFHLCQGYEGVHREYGPILPQIQAAYRLPIPKLLISAHLEPVLHGEFESLRTYLLGQAIDTSFFVPGPFRADAGRGGAGPLRFGVVGPYGVRSKAIGEALEGLEKARRRGVDLEVHHASADPLTEEEERLGVTNRFFHRLSTEEMVGFYQGLDALVHPSHDEEGFPLPPLEAMACGVPVALTRIRSFAVLPEEAALRFLPADPDSLVPVVERLADPHLRRRLRDAGLVCAKSFALDVVLDRMERAFAMEGAPVVGGQSVSLGPPAQQAPPATPAWSAQAPPAVPLPAASPADVGRPGSPARRRSVWKRLRDALGIAALSILLLGALELALRVGLRAATGAWPETRMSRFYGEITPALELYRRHPYLNVGPREGARVRAFGRQASFNGLGYRSPERPLAKPPGVVRILCAGGSTTFDILAADDAAAWPSLLEERLQRRGHRVEVWNAGFPGWTSLENLISLAVRDVDLEPDWIVLYQGINDLQPASHLPFDRQYEQGHADMARRTLGLELEPLSWHRRSLLLEKLRDALAGPANPWDAVRAESGATTRQRTVPPPAVAAFERNLRSIAALGRSQGARLLLVPQTLRLRSADEAADRALLAQWLPGLDPGAAPAALKQLDAAARSLHAEGLADLVDPPYSTWDDGQWSDPMHFSPEGSRRFAELLGKALALELARPGESP